MNQILLQFINTLDTAMKRFQAENFNELSKLTVHQLQYLEAIARLGSPTISEIAQSMGFSNPSVTAAIQKLAVSGYVTKQRSTEDGRVIHVNLTPKSERFKIAQQRTLAQYEEFIRASLSEEEREQFEHILQKLVNAFDQPEHQGEQS